MTRDGLGDCWIIEFDYRSDNGPVWVGPFRSRAEGQGWLVAGRDFDFEASVVPVAAPVGAYPPAPRPHHPDCRINTWEQRCNCPGDYCCTWPRGHAGACTPRVRAASQPSIDDGPASQLAQSAPSDHDGATS